MRIHIFALMTVGLRAALLEKSFAFSLQSDRPKRDRVILDASFPGGGRRHFLSTVASGLTVGAPVLVHADAEDEQSLTSKLFNPDGSLRDEGVTTEAKFRSVTINWEPSDNLAISIDGSNSGATQTGSSVRLSYELPEKWGSGDKLYVDLSESIKAKACNRITVYQAPGKVSVARLEKASTIGVGKALDVPGDLKEIQSADLIAGSRKSKGDGQRYFEFDMAVAPNTCESSSENLGLGFCPYESIYLLSATVLDDRLYVFVVECDKSEWKRANSDLRRLRSSFSVGSA